MSHKHLPFRSEAREKVLRGATAIADAVRVTIAKEFDPGAQPETPSAVAEAF